MDIISRISYFTQKWLFKKKKKKKETGCSILVTIKLKPGVQLGIENQENERLQLLMYLLLSRTRIENELSHREKNFLQPENEMLNFF